MIVLINSVSAKSGGASTYIRNLGRALTKSRHQYIFCLPSAHNSSDFSSANFTVMPSAIAYKSAWRRFLWDQFTLRGMIKARKADVLLSTSDFGMLLPPCKQVLMIRNPLFFSRLYLRHILPRKSWKFKMEFLFRRWLIALSAKSADMVITASESMRRDVQRAIPLLSDKVCVNPFGVPLDRFGASPFTDADKMALSRPKPFQILYVSEYSDYKNLATLLEAVLILRRQGREDFRLVTTADPGQFLQEEISTREKDRNLAAHPLVASCVKFTGRVPYEDIPKLYAQSDVFVFPSLAESFGHPLVEAMASRLPIVASDIDLCREMCGDAAVYFDPLNAKDLAEKISLLLDDADLRTCLAQVGRMRAESIFNWDDHVRRLLENLERTGSKQ